MTKTEKQRKNMKQYTDIINYFEINKVPNEIKEKVPKQLLEEYFYHIRQLENLNKQITETTKKWVEKQQDTIKIEEAINKLLKWVSAKQKQDMENHARGKQL